MKRPELESIADRLRLAGSDLTQIMTVIGSLAAEWVETRHFPPINELDGWRSRSDFVAYVMREADLFPRTFEAITVRAVPSVVEDHIAIDPLSFSGQLRGQERRVDIRYRLTLHFGPAGHLVKITGALTPENSKDDIVAWLKTIDLIGGLRQSRGLAQRPAA